jgi:hypothetical protein
MEQLQRISHSERIKIKIEEKTLYLMCDLQQIFGNLDTETYTEVQKMISDTLLNIADEVMLQKWIEGNN